MSTERDGADGWDAQVVGDIIARASSPGYESWWAKVTAAGYCAAPIRLTRTNEDSGGREVEVFARCKNRRASACPSCSTLYAGDTWQLVHAGLGGGHGIPATVAEHPAVFVTLTAPSFGPVHTATRPGHTGPARRCRAPRPGQPHARCRHGRPQWCTTIHDQDDPQVGEALCGDCYDYPAQVLWTWHAPALWARFTTALRRAVAAHLKTVGAPRGSVRVSFVKVVEMQRRGVPHFHTVIRLDNTTTDSEVGPTAPDRSLVSTAQLAALTATAATRAQLSIPSAGGELGAIRFGAQTDIQPLSAHDGQQHDTSGAAEPGRSRRVAGYLAKYVTKSVAEFGITARRLSPHHIATINVRQHTRRILHAITALAADPARAEMADWLHTLGYRGHVTTKSRRYSTTMTALRAHRAKWQGDREHAITSRDNEHPGQQPDAPTDDPDSGLWAFTGHPHLSPGDRLLTATAAQHARDALWAARELPDHTN